MSTENNKKLEPVNENLDMLGDDVEELSIDDINDFGGAGIFVMTASVVTDVQTSATATINVSPGVTAATVAMPVPNGENNNK